MQDDQKMLNISVGMAIVVAFLAAVLQVCYREQNISMKKVRNSIETAKHELEMAETKFSALSSSESLRNSVSITNPKAEVVSFSKTIHIDEIPMVQEQ